MIANRKLSTEAGQVQSSLSRGISADKPGRHSKCTIDRRPSETRLTRPQIVASSLLKEAVDLAIVAAGPYGTAGRSFETTIGAMGGADGYAARLGFYGTRFIAGSLLDGVAAQRP